jgi:hypothetical protein
MKKMCLMDPGARISASEALKHPYFDSIAAVEENYDDGIDEDIYNNIIQYKEK